MELGVWLGQGGVEGGANVIVCADVYTSVRLQLCGVVGPEHSGDGAQYH